MSKRKIGLTEVIVALVSAAILAVTNAWFAMLLIGNAHSQDPRIPALGFSTVLPLSLAVALVAGASARASRSSK